MGGAGVGSVRRCTVSERAMSDEEFYAGFGAGWVDGMTDDAHRRARDSSVRIALGQITGTLGALSQSADIRERNGQDEKIERVLREARDLLASIAKPEAARPRRARRRR